MEVKVAHKAGFCFGVRRAVGEAKSAANKYRRIFSLGDIIHNPQVVAELRDMGVKNIDSVSELSAGDTLIIRSHGAPPLVYSDAEKKGVKIIDLTCPFVKSAENHGRILKQKGHDVIIIGKPDHPEVIALSGHAKTDIIISSLEEVDEAIRGLKKVAVISQTTVPPERFELITDRIKQEHPDAFIINTICDATVERQKSARELAKEVDLMLVVGGRLSSNTQKLAEICKGIVTTHLIEDSTEIEKDWLVGVKKVGITAGASTPESIISEVIDALA